MLTVDDFCVEYWTDTGKIRAVDGVSFEVKAGEFVGLAGESGSGKSTLIQGLMRILGPPGVITRGEVHLDGVDVLAATDDTLQTLRWAQFSLVFQSAMNALNPVLTVAEQLRDTLAAHPNAVRSGKSLNAETLMQWVGLSDSTLARYPHELSGGMRQRVVFALALALQPRLLILDEPTTALDVVIQREILQRLVALKDQLGFGCLLITHDLPLMVQICDRIGILYGGKLVEMGPASAVGSAVSHPYTRALLGAFQSDDRASRVVEGPGLDWSDLPKGCRFCPRCPEALTQCVDMAPPEQFLGRGHLRACWLSTETPTDGANPRPQ